ncbi:beta-galactosidase, partial [Xanthomonas perforans]
MLFLLPQAGEGARRADEGRTRAPPPAIHPHHRPTYIETSMLRTTLAPLVLALALALPVAAATPEPWPAFGTQGT